MFAHVIEAFLLNRQEFMREAVADGTLTYLDGKCGCQVLATKDTKDVNIPEAVPAGCELTLH